MFKTLINLKRNQKTSLILTADFFFLLLSLWLSFSIGTGEVFIPHSKEGVLALVSLLTFFAIFTQFGLYRAVTRYFDIVALCRLLLAVVLYSLVCGALVFFSGVHESPFLIVLLNGFFTMSFIAGSRIVARWQISTSTLQGEKQPFALNTNVLIYGAGAAGVQLSVALSYGAELSPVAFLDDNRSLYGYSLGGLKVYPPSDLGELIELHSIKEVLLAIPSLSRQRKKEIVRDVEEFPVVVRTLPNVNELPECKVHVEDLKHVEIDDLLWRESVRPDDDLMEKCIKGKTVMVTGAGGSIGSELCKQILQLQPTRLVLFEMSEFSLYSIHEELKELKKEKGLRGEVQAVLGSVLSQELLRNTCKKFHVQTIYHAAAYKHVPILEEHPYEGVKNNVLGTLNAVQAAQELSVETFVLISTDKAVRPVNVMGATKRFAELILQAMHNSNPAQKEKGVGAKFCIVRFGNVLGSSGSVVPYFKKQIQSGGPVTVTHREITRYFMSISEASQLVIQAGAMAEGGDIFLLDMGEPVKIDDLARHMIRLSGLDLIDENNPNGDIAITYSGLRSGEKLYEELLIDDNALETAHPRIMRAKEKFIPWEKLLEAIYELKKESILTDKQNINDILKSVIEEYEPS